MPTLRFYNSLTKQVEPLTTREPGVARLYHCGPTVYKRQHLGNLRRYLFADFLRRTLEFFDYHVHEVTNITDVGHLTQDELDAGEDKLEREARSRHVTPASLAAEQTKLFFADLAALNIQPSHEYPRATASIPAMQALIHTLLARGHAYQTPSGIYFSVESFPAYGQLSGNTLAKLAAGKRVAVRSDKKNPADFALWIFDTKSLQHWDSPWGVGYPGWHIECSAMSLTALGPDIDIHTGGEDNRFPHHENEIAQSEAATGERFVRLWLHNRHLLLRGKKIAKRSGEQVTLDSLRLRKVSPLAFRLLVFGSHYRAPLDFSWEGVSAAETQLHSIAAFWRRLHESGPTDGGTPELATVEAFGAALAADLNTPQALAVVMQYLRASNTVLDAGGVPGTTRATMAATLQRCDAVLGLLRPLKAAAAAAVVPAAVTALVAEREAARAAGQYEAADGFRQKIKELGYEIEDTPTGPRVIPRPR